MKFNQRVRRVGPRHHLHAARSSAWPWTSPRRASTTSACASARSRATSRRPSSSPRARASAPSWRSAPAALAAKYGVPELAMEVKNLELPGYDPRGAFGMSLGYATSDRGGCHMRAYPVADEIVGGTLPPDTPRGQGRAGHRGQRGRRLHRRRTSAPSSSAASGATSGRSPRPDRADLQARLEARVQRGRGHADRRAHLEPRAPLQPARGRGARRHCPQKLYAEEGAFTDGPVGRQGDRRPRRSRRRCRSTTSCAAGTRTACPPRPSSPSSASTCASEAPAPRRKGEPMPHVMISSKKCTGCHMCELACSAWHEGAYRPSRRPPLRRGATRPPARSRATPACRPAAPSARRPAPTTPS